MTREMVALGLTPNRSPTKERKQMNSFIGGSIGGSFLEGQSITETEEQRTEREKKEQKDSFKVMAHDDYEKLAKSRDFIDFISKTGRIVERALDNDFDVVGDYFKDEEEVQVVVKGDKLTHSLIFQQNKQMKRTVTSIDWSPKVSELLLVSYSKCSEHRYDEPDGMVCIYSTSLKSRPEKILTCQYEVTKAIFNPFQPNTVIAATQSGYIVQWNVLQKTTPVQKSTLANDGHTHPIHSLSIIGT